MNKHHTVIIAGGGASGLFLAGLLGKDALVIEKNVRPGRKLLLTGGGSCNYTHDLPPQEMVRHYYDRRAFVTPSLYSLTSECLIEHFSSRGLDSVIREDGKVFPSTLRASDVLDVLMKDVKTIVTGEAVTSAVKDGNIFTVTTDRATYTSDYLVIATGGLSYPGTGSTGDGYALAKAFGHRIIPPTAALCQIRIRNTPFSDLEGISLEDITISTRGKSFKGPAVFTRKGISGPAAMNLSRYVTETEPVRICFASLSEDEIRNLGGRKKASGAISQLTGLPSRLVSTLAGPAGDKNISDLSKEDTRRIVSAISSYTFTGTTKKEGMCATVTQGGVDTGEVDRKSLESRLCPRLYIIGECLDVDGECGGYNLSFAFASAFLAAASIRKS